ncbi:TPA: hypothetical protein EYP38_02380 [Candidatus Micrarchaeota archaeon]|nr:hypothetical protein [Candidatus Micrarchaeota archaeon]
MDEPDKFAWFYREPEIDRARELVLLHPEEKQTEILIEMRSFNWELSGRVMDKMPDSKRPYR